jgi:hypothetical protein
LELHRTKTKIVYCKKVHLATAIAAMIPFAVVGLVLMKMHGAAYISSEKPIEPTI